MQTELNDSALTRLQLYYDSRIFNYDYLSQTTADAWKRYQRYDAGEW